MKESLDATHAFHVVVAAGEQRSLSAWGSFVSVGPRASMSIPRFEDQYLSLVRFSADQGD